MIAGCDGACKKNPGPAAWAWVLVAADGSEGRWQAGPLGTATNNIAELTALERLLTEVDPAVQLEVRMDSQYAMKAVTEWLPGWKRRGWKTASGGPVANRELVMSIDELLAGRDVRLVHVAAHQVNGDPFNALADEAASACAVSQRAAGAALPAEKALAMVTAAASGGGGGGGSAGGSRPGPGSGAGSGSGPAKRSSAKSTFSGTLKAKYPGSCPCGRRYEAGTVIAKGPKGWGHPECSGSTAEATA
jgi:ribonuclease HI